MLHRAVRALLKAIYPPRCPACDSFVDDYGFCEGCAKAIKLISPPWCEVCGRPLDPLAKTRGICADCSKWRPNFVKARAGALYEGPVAEAIKRLKYGGRTSASRALAGLLERALASLDIPLDERVVLVPVPLHPLRLRERGFNQSELLAREAGGRMGLKVERKVLGRRSHTRPQVELSGRERRENVKGAFEVMRADLVEGRVVVLIDDVMTTGATLSECAKALVRAGLKEVYAAVVAREAGAP